MKSIQKKTVVTEKVLLHQFNESLVLFKACEDFFMWLQCFRDKTKKDPIDENPNLFKVLLYETDT